MDQQADFWTLTMMRMLNTLTTSLLDMKMKITAQMKILRQKIFIDTILGEYFLQLLEQFSWILMQMLVNHHLEHIFWMLHCQVSVIIMVQVVCH